MNCPKCNHKIHSGDLFCAECGAGVDQTPSSSKEAGARTGSGFRGFLGTLLLVLVGGVFVQNFFIIHYVKRLGKAELSVNEGFSHFHGSSSGEGGGAASTAASVEPISDEAAMVFASMYTPCDKCPKMVLAESTCPHENGAVKTKRLINQLFQEGRSKKEVFDFVVTHYGESILTPQARQILMAGRQKAKK